MRDKVGNPDLEANYYIEIKPLSQSQVRITCREFKSKGKSIIVSNEKYSIVESMFGERSVENESTELIRKIFNLESHQVLVKALD
jgi:hypothetical protein